MAAFPRNGSLQARAVEGTLARPVAPIRGTGNRGWMEWAPSSFPQDWVSPTMARNNCRIPMGLS